MKDSFQGTVCWGEASAKSAEACLPIMVRIRGDGRPARKPFVPASNVVMVLDQSAGMQPHPRALQLDFLQADSTEQEKTQICYVHSMPMRNEQTRVSFGPSTSREYRKHRFRPLASRGLGDQINQKLSMWQNRACRALGSIRSRRHLPAKNTGPIRVQ